MIKKGMIPYKNRYLNYIYLLLVLILCFQNLLFSQTFNFHKTERFPGLLALNQDSSRLKKNSSQVRGDEPDTNFTFERYASFLKKISDTSKYIVLPINEFRNTENSRKIVIGLRHDLDVDLKHAFSFSDIEWNLGFRSTYYILHTAPYYLNDPTNFSVHSEKIIPILKNMQDERHFEIGFHNDLVTLQAVYNIDPVKYLHGELSWLRSNGIKIYGSASHGSPYCKTYKYLNYYFFEECTYPVVTPFVNNLTVPVGSKTITIKKGKMSDFDLEYEAYFLNNNKYYSDATITAGKRWYIGMLDLSKLQPGDRVIILIHPIHWHKASVNAEIQSFNVRGENMSEIDTVNSVIKVIVPSWLDLKHVAPDFVLSPGAMVKVSGKMQKSGIAVNDFTTTLSYVVYAENRDVKRVWTVNVIHEKNKSCDFESFSVPGFTGDITIDREKKTILAELNENADLTQLQIEFQLSAGAKTYLGDTEQKGNTGYFDFTKTLRFRVIAEDGANNAIWTITIVRKTDGYENGDQANGRLTVYPNPTTGNIRLQFHDVTIVPSSVEIYTLKGEKIFSQAINKAGSFTIDADLSRYQPGVFFVKYSLSGKPIKVILRKG